MDLLIGLSVVCKCGHNLVVELADPPDDGGSNYFFVARCANEPVCQVPKWHLVVNARDADAPPPEVPAQEVPA